MLMGAALPGAATAADDFAACVGELQERARGAGISADIVDEQLGAVEFRERVIELDRRQPEFVTPFHEYYNARVTASRVERGRELMREHEDLLQAVYREFGVPPRYLVAFWGLETNFGSFFGRMPALDSLATLACDGRRGDMFSNQLIDALHIIDGGHIDAERMEGSWAGAMGHFQFMPSVFREHAVDYDDDGRRDLWGSVPDAMASAANFLAASGWRTGYRWGREVRLPDDFHHELAGSGQPRPLDEWRALGVRTADGGDIGAADIDAALLLPAGHRGPAFLVYHNFDVIMRWNPSEFYALAVGRLADRIAGAGRLRQPPPSDVPTLHRDDIIALQRALRQRGFLASDADGIIGPVTRDAIRNFQLTLDMVADGYPSARVLTALGLEPAGDD